MKIAAVGFACVDIYANLGVRYATGNGIDLIFNLKTLFPGADYAAVTAVGDDENGDMLLDACRERGVDCSHVTVVPGQATAVYEMLLNGGDRVHHRAEKGVMASYRPTGRDMDFIRGQQYVHTDLSWDVVDLLRDMRANGTRVYFDFSKKHEHPDLERVFPNIDYGIFSFEEDCAQARELLKAGCGMGATVMLATFGEGGSLAFDGNTFYRQAAIDCEQVVNTVGAGDSFGAGFLAGVIRGQDTAACMREGAALASRIVGIFPPYPEELGRAPGGRKL